MLESHLKERAQLRLLQPAMLASFGLGYATQQSTITYNNNLLCFGNMAPNMTVYGTLKHPVNMCRLGVWFGLYRCGVSLRYRRARPGQWVGRTSLSCSRLYSSPHSAQPVLKSLRPSKKKMQRASGDCDAAIGSAPWSRVFCLSLASCVFKKERGLPRNTQEFVFGAHFALLSPCWVEGI